MITQEYMAITILILSLLYAAKRYYSESDIKGLRRPKKRNDDRTDR